MLPRHLAMHLYTHSSLGYGIGYSSINWNQISRMEMRGLDGCEERWRVNEDVLAGLRFLVTHYFILFAFLQNRGEGISKLSLFMNISPRHTENIVHTHPMVIMDVQ